MLCNALRKCATTERKRKNVLKVCNGYVLFLAHGRLFGEELHAAGGAAGKATAAVADVIAALFDGPGEFGSFIDIEALVSGDGDFGHRAG